MLILALDRFLAGNDQLNPKTLGGGIGVSATNLETRRADMRGIKGLSTVATVSGIGGQVKSIYRWGRDTLSDANYWVGSTLELDFARSMLASDPTERTYVTGGGQPPRYFDSTGMGSAPYPSAFTALGVPPPFGAMTLALSTAGTGPDETRVYLDTFVRTNGDESAPNASPASITVKGGSTVTISNLAAVPSGSHGISTRRIYVFTGSGAFLRCVDQAASTTTATDTGTRGLSLTTGGKDDVDPGSAWTTPPDELHGLLPLWNGMMLGGVGKAIRICYPYKPHAWPIKYEYALPDAFVGAATWGQSVLIATTGYPRVASGSAPGGMNPVPIFLAQAACVSKRSIKGVGHGVCWASNVGLCYHGQRGTGIITENLISEATWQSLNPATIIGGNWGRYYIGIYSATKAFMIDTTAPNGVIWLDIGGNGVFEDSISGNLYIVGEGNTVGKFAAGTGLTATFKSGVIRTKEYLTAARGRVDATTYPVQFKLWADGVLVHDAAITSKEVFTITNHRRATLWQVELSGSGPIEAVSVATDGEELP